jgi:hypothetical protein
MAGGTAARELAICTTSPATTHHAPTYLAISLETHIRPSLREIPSESFPVCHIEEVLLPPYFVRCSRDIGVKAWEDASLLDLQTTHRPYAELVDTASGGRGPEAHRRFRAASPAASPDLYTATTKVSRAKMLQAVAVGARVMVSLPLIDFLSNTGHCHRQTTTEYNNNYEITTDALHGK